MLLPVGVPNEEKTKVGAGRAVGRGRGHRGGPPRAFDPVGVEEVDLATVEYLRERTRVSPDGPVVKGTTGAISGLREGDHVLRITIEDLVGGKDCAETVAFRRLAPASKLTAVDE